MKPILAANKKRTIVANHAAIAKIKEDAGCLDCGAKHPHYVLQFDHVRGEKNGDVSKMIQDTRSIVVIMEEIGKCEVVCANCHSTRTFNRRNPPGPQNFGS